MNSESWQLFSIFIVFIAMLFIIGLYCLIVTRNLIRALIGLEILTKAVTLLLISAGYFTNHTALSQSLVITLIVIEVVVIMTAGGVVINVYRNNDSLDARKLRNLRG